MAVVGENPPCPFGLRYLAWSRQGSLAVSHTSNRGHDVTTPQCRLPLDYAVMTEGSCFPAGWVRFNEVLAGYVFSTLLPGCWGSGSVHDEPGEAVPDWIGAHRLKAIHPIPQDLTGDMMAAAPAMLALLKQVRGLLEQGTQLPGIDLDDLDHVLDVAEGRG